MPLRAEASSPLAARRPGLVLLVVGAGTFLSALAGSAVALALPGIGLELRISLQLSSWIMQGFLLVVTALLLVAGRLGDLWGHRRIYLSGFVVFGVAAGLCGLAQSFWLLVTARLLQGVGGAAVMATAPALLTTSFPSARRGQALGMQATATYAGLTIGPPLGGFVIAWLGWRWIFFLNFLATLVVFALGIRLLPRDARQSRQPIDGLGAVTLLLGLPLLLLALTQGGSWGWASWPVLSASAAAVALLTTFVYIERILANPLVRLELFRSPVFSGSALSAVCNYVALFVPVILLPFYLTEGLQLTPARAGLLLSLQPLLMTLVASPSGTLSDRLGTRPLATTGMLLVAAALAGMATLGESSGLAHVGLWLSLVGLGTGVFISPNSSALMGSAPSTQQGTAGGVLAVARNLGMLLGVAAAAALFHAAGGETGRSWVASDYRALRLSLAAAAGIALVGALAAYLGQREPVNGEPSHRLGR